MEVLSTFGVSLREDDLKKALQHLFSELNHFNASFEIAYTIEDGKLTSKSNVSVQERESKTANRGSLVDKIGSKKSIKKSLKRTKGSTNRETEILDSKKSLSKNQTSNNIDEKIKNLQRQKCQEFLLQNNNAGVYGLVSSCRDLLADFFMTQTLFPFDFFSSHHSKFPFISLEKENLMRKSISCVLSAAFSIYSNSGGNYLPVRFVRVSLEDFGLKTPVWKKLVDVKIERLPSEEHEKASLHSSQSMEKALQAHFRETVVEMQKVITLVPQFHKRRSELTLVKVKEFRSSEFFSVKWFDYNPKFDLEPVTKNFSLAPFDCLVHDFGIQGFMMRSLVEFLLKYSSALRITTESYMKQSTVGESSTSNADVKKFESKSEINFNFEMGTKKEIHQKLN